MGVLFLVTKTQNVIFGPDLSCTHPVRGMQMVVSMQHTFIPQLITVSYDTKFVGVRSPLII